MTAGERITIALLAFVLVASCLFVFAIGLEESDAALAVFGALVTAVWMPVLSLAFWKLDRAMGEARRGTQG